MVCPDVSEKCTRTYASLQISNSFFGIRAGSCLRKMQASQQDSVNIHSLRVVVLLRLSGRLSGPIPSIVIDLRMLLIKVSLSLARHCFAVVYRMTGRNSAVSLS